jgi:hypothetical protein
MTTESNTLKSKSSNRGLWSLLIAVTLVAVSFLAFPIYVIRPFRSQGPRELAASLVVSSWSPLVSAICAAIAIVLAMVVARRISSGRVRLKQWAAVSIALLAVFVALASRVNIFEKMFHPIRTAQFLPAAQANTEAKEMVLAVKVGGEQRAYPVAIGLPSHLQ